MFEVTAFKWVPAFAQGQVRDLRVRWALEEAGLPYRVRLIDAADQASAAYRAEQPFGQVPVLRDGDRVLFESGAILLLLGERTPALLPVEPDLRAQAICWLFAALNSVEEGPMLLAEVDFFMDDAALQAKRRPAVVDMIRKRLGELAIALGPRDWLIGDRFTIADLMMASVLRILDHTDLVAEHPALAAYKARCEARPAFAKALADQLADFAAHRPSDAA